MASKPVQYYKDFSNVEEVFKKLLELNFFVNEEQMAYELATVTNPLPGPFDTNEFWYSNGVIEVKIIRGLFGAYELRNFRGIKHKMIDELFQVGALSRVESVKKATDAS